MRSRVMPGSSPTIARRSPVIRLKSVDFPTLGRPTITTVGSKADMHPHDNAAARVNFGFETLPGISGSPWAAGAGSRRRESGASEDARPGGGGRRSYRGGAALRAGIRRAAGAEGAAAVPRLGSGGCDAGVRGD